MGNVLDSALELWGGIECTINRVGDSFLDQRFLQGFRPHATDFEQIRALGIRTLRFPVLWEAVAPNNLDEGFWENADQSMAHMQSLGITPIVGLLHHGSGPRYTNLLDPEFPQKFAAYARLVAQRYPSVRYYTPINEPLTTARFSALYGFWFPHCADNLSFITCLLHQCRGIALAMQEIQKVNPEALFIFTEDFGRTSSTPLLSYQAIFENDRRWLSADLLCGKVVPGHPLWKWLLKNGADIALLERMSADICRPALIGMNHYLTSNRFLDENLQDYPEQFHGGNGRHSYADVEAVRVQRAPLFTRGFLLKEIWERFGLPMAVTETHLSGTREEQMRWLYEMWTTASELRQQEIDVRAVTVWSLFGAFDWDSLVTKPKNLYEAGLFDLRSPIPRPTALAQLVRSLAATGHSHDPLVQEKGWWQRPIRSLYPLPSEASPRYSIEQGGILIVGGGTLGSAFARLCEARALPYRLITHRDFELTAVEKFNGLFDSYRPSAVINAAGIVDVDKAETDPQHCFDVNSTAAIGLAEMCSRHSIPYLHFSSDLVFDGSTRVPYKESDLPNPLNVYGKSKRRAELGIGTIYPKSLIIRTSAFFGPWDEQNFLKRTIQQLQRGERVIAANDVCVSPTYVPELVSTALDLLIDQEHGIWHLAQAGQITWAEWAYEAARRLGKNADLIDSRSATKMPWRAKRPQFSVLSSERGLLMSPFETVLDLFFKENDIPAPETPFSPALALSTYRQS